MTEEERKENSARLKAVEEAVIEFRTIARTVVVDHSKRLDGHDKDISEIKTTIYLSCDAKTQEVDIKVEKSEELMLEAITQSEARLTEMINKQFTYGIWAISGTIGLIGVICTLALTWVSYDNSQISNLSDKLSIRESVSVKNRENILSTQEDVGHLRTEIKEVKEDIHTILNKLIKGN